MSLDIAKIRGAKNSMEDIKTLEKSISEALAPLINDMNLLEEVYRHYLVFLEEKKERMDVNHRKRFLFIAAYLFCPGVLIGGKMPQGFRARLQEVIHVNSSSTISNEVVNLLFLYGCYHDFRDGVNEAFEHVANAMGF